MVLVETPYVGTIVKDGINLLFFLILTYATLVNQAVDSLAKERGGRPSFPLYPDLLAIKGSKFYFGCGLWIELHRLQLGDTSLLQHLNENKYHFYEDE